MLARSGRLLLLCLLLIDTYAACADPPAAAPHTDGAGDPMPDGAIARLGTLRFRHQYEHISASAISPDGKIVVTAGDTGTLVRFWDLQTGKELRRVEAMTLGDAVAYSASGKLVAVATTEAEDNVYLLGAHTGKEVRRLDGLPAIRKLAFAPRRKRSAFSMLALALAPAPFSPLWFSTSAAAAAGPRRSGSPPMS